MPNVVSYAEFNFLPPSGSWVSYSGPPYPVDWKVAGAREDAKTGTLTLDLEVAAVNDMPAAHTQIHVERIAAEKVRVPEWNEEFFRCTDRR